ncbi:MAG: hypothetical protein DRP80_07395 [Candidatus Omnitrophota bacterium]|nr:MAG: hypothetical protein DRP80_07395 [Candidatus Omnitrophota bacterium]
MKEKGMILFLIFILSLTYSCSKETRKISQDISLESLLPDLELYGYETKKIFKANRENLAQLYKSVAQRFGIDIESIKDRIPIDRIGGIYEGEGRKFSITIQKYRNEKGAKKELNREVKSIKELEEILNRQKSVMELKLKKVRINGQEGYYQIYGGGPVGDVKRQYNTKLFWVNGVYIFEISSIGEEIWPEEEVIKIAEEIGY